MPGYPFARRDDAAGLRTLLAQDARQLAGVDVGDADDAFVAQVRGEVALHPEVGRALRKVADDEAGRVHARRLDVLGVHAGVADVRVRQGDDLSLVGRVGQDFLIPAHGRVEDDFTQRAAGCADRTAAKDRSVGQH